MQTEIVVKWLSENKNMRIKQIMTVLIIDTVTVNCSSTVS